MYPRTHSRTYEHQHTSFLQPCRSSTTSHQRAGQQRAGLGEVQLLQLMSPERIRQSYLRPRPDQTAPVSQSWQFPRLLSRACSLVSWSSPPQHLDCSRERSSVPCDAVQWINACPAPCSIAPPASASSGVIWGGASSLLQQLNRSRAPACAPPNIAHGCGLQVPIWVCGF